MRSKRFTKIVRNMTRNRLARSCSSRWRRKSRRKRRENGQTGRLHRNSKPNMSNGRLKGSDKIRCGKPRSWQSGTRRRRSSSACRIGKSCRRTETSRSSRRCWTNSSGRSTRKRRRRSASSSRSKRSISRCWWRTQRCWSASGLRRRRSARRTSGSSSCRLKWRRSRTGCGPSGRPSGSRSSRARSAWQASSMTARASWRRSWRTASGARRRSTSARSWSATG
mmetsp:Transcript_20067/g.47858  ORF Transcript_20067/g.47858 Transcript_20067/m.47858 type:complete len:223 (-) Transcript_20067:492-1160(-)